ncbi:MAG: ABC transporter ATP-binding protein, partial [Ruminiclostridium sp.]|nr:ABC transporter ATP-binding protein [Ruminiclostridium sp.]
SERDGERTILFSTHNIADMESATDYAIFMSAGHVIEQGFVEDLKDKYILIHGDAENGNKAKPLMLSCTVNSTAFEGIALAEEAGNLEAVGAITERPTLQQLSVGIMRKAEKDAEK